jgi:hypothetical protein
LGLGRGVVRAQPCRLGVGELVVLRSFEPLDRPRRESGRAELVQRFDELGVLLPEYLTYRALWVSFVLPVKRAKEANREKKYTTESQSVGFCQDLSEDDGLGNDGTPGPRLEAEPERGAVLGHGRKLKEVAAQDQLHPSERRGLALRARRANGLELVEQVAVQHRDLIHDQHLFN